MNKLIKSSPFLPSLFNNFFDDIITPYWDVPQSPTIKVSSDEKAYYLKADVPGFDDNDVQVEVKDNIIHLSGKIENKSEQDGRFVSDIKSFSHSYSLPNDIISDEISADMKNGILVVSLPKRKIEKKQIPIKKIKIGKT